MEGDKPDMIITREWAMPCADTFDCKPIGDFVKRYLSKSKVSIDPFARNRRWATYTNDLDPNTSADHHIDAREWLKWMHGCLVKPDTLINDPPYSPRQISECYKSIGRECTMTDTQNAKLYKEVKDLFKKMAAPGAIVLSFGWNSSGMGIGRGFEIEEILMVCHGAAHNDTICVAERHTGISRVKEFQQALDNLDEEFRPWTDMIKDAGRLTEKDLQTRINV